MSWVYIWSRIRAIPAGAWAAAGVALALFGMYMRGRRLEAALAEQKLKTHAADAAAKSAKSIGRAEVHLERAAAHEEAAEVLEKQAETIKLQGKKEDKRIAALPPKAVTSEYLRIAAAEKAKLP